MKTVGEVLLNVKLLVGLKHLLMVCKAAVLQTLLGHLRTLLQASTISETGDPKERHTLVCKSYLSSQGWGYFPLHFMNELWLLSSKAFAKEVRP